MSRLMTDESALKTEFSHNLPVQERTGLPSIIRQNIKAEGAAKC